MNNIRQFLQSVRVRLAAFGAGLRAFYGRNRLLVLGGFTVFSILLVVWARLGFTLDISRFYAASPPAVLSVQCGATQNVLTWTLVPGRDSNSILRSVDGADGVWVCGGPNSIPPCTNLDVSTFTDTNVQPGHTYSYAHKSSPPSRSNDVKCPAPTPTPTATPSPTATATASPTVSPSPTATVTPTATVAPTPTATTTPGPTRTATPPPGCYYQEIQCITTPCDPVLVCPTATPAPTVPSCIGEGGTLYSEKDLTCCPGLVPLPGPNNYPYCGTPAPTLNLSFVVSGRNISTTGPEGTTVAALGGQQVEVIARLRNGDNSGILNNTIIRAALPGGVTYVNGSTTVNNAPTTVNAVAAGGLALGGVGPGQQMDVRFKVRINGPSFPIGVSQASIVVQAVADGMETRSGSVTLTVTRNGAGTANPGTVQTGPGDAVLVALLVSAAVTMLYVSYTRSPVFRRHEAEHLSDDQGPMDFRP